MTTPPEKPTSKQPIPQNAKKVFDGIIFSAYQWEQPQYDGSLKTFEKLKRANTVQVIPVTTQGKFIFSKEEQPGKQPFIGFLGGRVEEGEDPTEAAKRELLEETGYQAEEMLLVEAVQPITKVEWAVYTFVARGCHKVAEQELDSGEKIELIYLSFNEAVDFMAQDDFADREGNLPRLAIRAQYDPTMKQELKLKLLGAQQ